MKLLVVVASTRPTRVGPAVADWFLAQVPADPGLEVSVADLADSARPVRGAAVVPGGARFGWWSATDPGLV